MIFRLRNDDVQTYGKVRLNLSKFGKHCNGWQSIVVYVGKSNLGKQRLIKRKNL